MDRPSEFGLRDSAEIANKSFAQEMPQETKCRSTDYCSELRQKVLRGQVGRIICLPCGDDNGGG